MNLWKLVLSDITVAAYWTIKVDMIFAVEWSS